MQMFALQRGNHRSFGASRPQQCAVEHAAERHVNYFHNLDAAIIEVFDSGRAPSPWPEIKALRRADFNMANSGHAGLFMAKFNSRVSPVLEVRRTWPNLPGQEAQIFSQTEQCPGDTDFISLMAKRMHGIEVSTSSQAIIHQVSGPTPSLTTLPAR